MELPLFLEKFSEWERRAPQVDPSASLPLNNPNQMLPGG
ncbi:hypothetical protein LEP1GSC037_0088, partial [Leptospira interrogans str. 2006001854]